MKPDSSDSLTFECDLDEPPEKVWRALTEPELLEAWLAPDDVSRAARADGTAEVTPEERPVPYEIVTADPHRLLRYRWRDREDGVGDSVDREVQSLVTVELVPSPQGGTHLRLTHGEFTIVSAAAATTAARVTPITSARRWRTVKASSVTRCSFATQCSLRRAA